MVPILSIVIPIYNEEKVIPETYKRVNEVLIPLDISYEIIIIDDGSSDRSYEILSEIAESDSNLKVISFSRNFGHQAALVAGLDFAAGRAIITMDGDLQHPPELIPVLLEKWREGYEVVQTVKTFGKEVGFVKKIATSFFYKLLNWLAQIELPSGAADFRLFDRKVVNCLKSMKERSRFLRGLSMWVGYKQACVAYKVAPRAAGEPKYTVGTLMKLLIDGIMSFSIFPLKLAAFFGFLVSFVSFTYLCYALYMRLVADKAPPGWASVVVPMLFLGGIQLIAIGILGGYIGRIYEEVKERPVYLVSKKCGFEESSKDEKGNNSS